MLHLCKTKLFHLQENNVKHCRYIQYLLVLHSIYEEDTVVEPSCYKDLDERKACITLYINEIKVCLGIQNIIFVIP